MPKNETKPKICVECGEEIKPGHVFECRKCDDPMCHPCWVKAGKDCCQKCSPQI